MGIVFKELRGSRSYREMDHKIHLKGGVKTINVRSYRYPHLLKEEIEKQVEEML